MAEQIQLISLNIGTPKKLIWKGEPFETAVQKKSVKEAFLSFNGFNDDDVANKKHHGGPDRAVLIYAYEHYSFWEKEFGKQFQVPGFGENLTATGMKESEVYIGDTYQVGDAIIQVTQGRIPCQTLSQYNEENHLLKRIVETGYTGILCRVLKEGILTENSPITLIERDPKSVTVQASLQVYYHQNDNTDAAKNIIHIEALAERWREQLINRYNLQERH
ncbi:MOSC domain-containing protein [Metabacillus arenae]|uniref:MOSC domain-containing protein n=1 Tax=Metabacillus arenae TaxID=2771434 RepID=A0A926NIX6_9BACI|nr:MOSC domain-containing protein [Metabacillus arenae]MBD1382554.1 MOSC domain-containing protein [Metabacillus arenae]